MASGKAMSWKRVVAMTAMRPMMMDAPRVVMSRSTGSAMTPSQATVMASVETARSAAVNGVTLARKTGSQTNVTKLVQLSRTPFAETR
jgi:hypothetical protein